MSTKPTQIEQHDTADTSSFPLGLARLFWTILGPLMLLGTIAQNAARPGGWLSAWDAAVGIVVAAMIACRWLEQRSGKARTAYGDPSTPAHFRQYVIILVIVAGIAWAIANVLGNHILS